MDYEFIQTPIFRDKAKKYRLSEEDVRLIELEIQADPNRFPVIAGTGALRKMRFAPAAMNTGKSGGIRVCYFVIVDAKHVYLVTFFPKNEKDNLGHADKEAANKLIERTKKAYQK